MKMIRMPRPGGFLAVMALVVGIAGGALADPIRSAPRYTVRDVGAWPEGGKFLVQAMNNRGDIVGRGRILYADGSTETRGWHSENKINDHGQTLPHLADFDINNRGQSVGYRNFPWQSDIQASLTTDGETVMISPAGSTVSRAWAINDLGHAAGVFSTGDGIYHPFLYKDGQSVALERPFPDGGPAMVRGMNNLDQIVMAYTRNGRRESYVYSDGEYTHLNGVPGLDFVDPKAINDLGQVVGQASFEDGAKGFLYQDGDLFDLNDLVPPTLDWTITSVFDLNDRGQILVEGWDGGNGTTALLLTPVPEPGAIAVLAAGGLALLWKKRRSVKG